MNTKVITRTESFVEIDDVQYEVRLEPDRHSGIKSRKLDDGRMVIGYLMHDNDCSNPLEDCDGMGKIIEHRSQADADETSEALAENHMIVPLSKFEHSGVIWGVMGSLNGMPDFCWDGTRFAGRWEPDKCCVEHIRSSAIAGLLPKGCKVEYKSKHNPDGTCITRPARPGEKPHLNSGEMVDERYSNVITLIMPDGKEIGGFKSFEAGYRSACRRLGIKITAASRRQGERKVAIECAASACREFTSWCNGDCHGVIVVTCAPDGSMEDSDECWGYIGSEYAEKTLQEQMDNVK
jgi:hypothetical protein